MGLHSANHKVHGMARERMKVGIIVHCPSPHQTLLLSELLGTRDVDVVVAYAYPVSAGRRWGLHRVDGSVIDVPTLDWLRPVRSYSDWINGFERDIWVLGASFTYPRTQCLAQAIDRVGVPRIVMAEPPRPRVGVRGALRDVLMMKIISRSGGVIATGIESARRYRVIVNDRRPIGSVPYFVALDEWLAIPLAVAPEAGRPVRFLALSQLTERKGIDLLLKACTMIPSDGWHLDIFGDGPDRLKLQSIIHDQQLPIVLHPEVPFDRRSEVFRSSHCVICPSRWDGWGVVTLESLAAGRPVIASDQTMSAHDLIKDGVNGWVVSPTSEQIASRMALLIGRPELVATMAASARAAALSHNVAHGAQEFFRICREVLDRGR